LLSTRGNAKQSATFLIPKTERNPSTSGKGSGHHHPFNFMRQQESKRFAAADKSCEYSHLSAALFVGSPCNSALKIPC